MSGLFIVPAKPIARAKMRLADVFTPDDRRELVLAMLADVTDACAANAETWVLCSDADTAAVARRHHAEPVTDETPDAGLNPSLLRALALARGRPYVVVVASDLPCLRPQDLTDLPIEGVAIAPSVDGTGTNLLALGPPSIITPAFGPDSRHRHEAAAKESGVTPTIVALERLALDVDTQEDLRRARQLGPGPHTTAFLDRMGW